MGWTQKMKILVTGEDIVKDYHRCGAFDYAGIRPSTVYGPLNVEESS
jgi:nucleoside-diphosphate-sugar epimerase